MATDVAEGPPPQEQGRLLANAVLFARLLRVGGLGVTPDQVGRWIEALDHVDLASREQVRDAARAVLVTRSSELPWFEAAFDLFWRARDAEDLERIELGLLLQRQEQARAEALRVGDAETDTDSDEQTPQAVWSERERLEEKPFADMDEEERREVAELLSAMDWKLPPVRSRRTRAARRGRSLDLRHSLRRSLRTGGELVDLAWRRRRTRPRTLVLLCDVSGSMEPYARILLHFAYALGHRRDDATRVESFAFGTRLTRLSPSLRGSVDRAVSEAAEQIRDWGGGTRTGDALRELNRRWGRRVLGSGSVVLIVSDGWDRGDPDLLAREIGRLSRTCGRLIWLNPLLGSPDYEPLTRGMAAALPHLDDFLPVHNLRSLRQLAELLERAFHE